MKHRCKITKGKIDIYNLPAYLNDLSGISGEAVIDIRPWKPVRSGNQNRYYRGVVLSMIEDYTGQDADDLHHYFRAKFLGVDDKGGIEIPISTTILTTKEMENYMEAIKRFASVNLGLYIPDPNEAPLVEQRI